MSPSHVLATPKPSFLLYNRPKRLKARAKAPLAGITRASAAADEVAEAAESEPDEDPVGLEESLVVSAAEEDAEAVLLDAVEDALEELLEESNLFTTYQLLSQVHIENARRVRFPLNGQDDLLLGSGAVCLNVLFDRDAG
jgi:hypothetical protein